MAIHEILILHMYFKSLEYNLSDCQGGGGGVSQL